jgi:phage baseplate assembly protein W
VSAHLKVPFQVEGESALVVGDGTLDEGIQNVDVVLRSRRGDRLMSLDFGISDQVFDFRQSSPDLVEIEAAVAQWEPRARLSFSERIEEGVTSRVQIGVRMIEAAL